MTLAVVFVAELGDKSQLMAMAAAARHPAAAVLAGILVAAAGVHALSVLAGRALAEALSGPAATVLAGVAFLGFALWTLRGDDEEGAVDPAARRSGLAAAAAVAGTFFAAEVGDKTMLATAALAARQGAVPTWAGATLGMVAADGLAIAAGRRLAATVSRRAVRLASAAVFALFGVALVVQGVL